MRLSTWIALRGRGALKWLERETKRIDRQGQGVSYSTLHKAARSDHPLTYVKAELVQRATGGAVSIGELCAPDDLAPMGDQENGNTQAQ